MKKINRLFALALAMLMCICLVIATSCGDNNGDNEDPISSNVDYGNADYEVYDMGGDTIHVLGFYSIVATSETSSSEEGILKIARRKEIEELYNCKFKMEVISGQEQVCQQVKASHLAGDVRADVFCSFAGGVLNLGYQGLLYPASDVIDFSRPQWNQNVREAGTINGKVFMFVDEPNNIENLVTFKPQYLDTYGIENPYDLIKEGKWTTDKYLEIVQRITSLGAASGVYGANKVDYDPEVSLVLALFGTYWVGKDADGYYYSNLDDGKIIEALNWLQKVNQTAPPSSKGDAVSVFEFPRANTGLGNVSKTDPNQENKYYWCDPPMSSYITETPNFCQAANARAMPMLLGDERAKQVGTIYARYCEPLGDTPEETARIDADIWYSKTYNKESADIIMAYRERGSEMLIWQFSGGIWNNVSKPVQKAIQNGENFASVIESIKDAWEGYLDERNQEMDI